MHESSRSIRQRLDHPVIDIDGHCIEFFPGLARDLREEGSSLDSPSLARLCRRILDPTRAGTAWTRRARRAARGPGHRGRARGARTHGISPPRVPRLLHERLDELGIDVSVVYPSAGLGCLHLWDERERRGACRGLNRANADAFAGLDDRACQSPRSPCIRPTRR